VLVPRVTAGATQRISGQKWIARASRAYVELPAHLLAEAAIDSQKPQGRHISATLSFRYLLTIDRPFSAAAAIN
jgi:hypothetical protein